MRDRVATREWAKLMSNSVGPSGNSDSLVEAFQNTFFYFIKALHVMSWSQDEQLVAMDHSNAAWEIQHDVLDQGAALVNWIPQTLQNSEHEAIRLFLERVHEMPVAALTSDSQAMEHFAWTDMRIYAKQLLGQLENAITKNQEYFENLKKLNDRNS
jgi:hypothetical protein